MTPLISCVVLHSILLKRNQAYAPIPVKVVGRDSMQQDRKGECIIMGEYQNLKFRFVLHLIDNSLQKVVCSIPHTLSVLSGSLTNNLNLCWMNTQPCRLMLRNFSRFTKISLRKVFYSQFAKFEALIRSLSFLSHTVQFSLTILTV